MKLTLPDQHLADLETYDPEEFTAAVYAGVADALGSADLETVKRVMDETLADVMEVVAHTQGPKIARQTAQKFAETLAPYAGRVKAVPMNTYAALSKAAKK